MKKVSELLDNNFSKSITNIIKINTIWKHIVGENIAKFTLPVRIVKGTLNVMVFDPIWQHELSFLKEELIEKIPDEFIINDIRFFVQYKKNEDYIIESRTLTDKEQKIIERLVKNVNDTELKEKIKSALIAYFKNFSYEESLYLE